MKQLILIMASFASLYAHAQYEWQWEVQFNDSEFSEITAAMTCEDGYVLAGSFCDSLALGKITLNSNGGKDVFLLKIDSDGNIVTAISFGGQGDDSSTDMKWIDGNILLLGQSFNEEQVLFILSLDVNLVIQKYLSFPFSGIVRPDFIFPNRDGFVIGGSLKGVLHIGNISIGDNKTEHAFCAILNTEGEILGTWSVKGNSINRLHSMATNNQKGYFLLLSAGKGLLQIPKMDPLPIMKNEVVLLSLDSLWNPVWLHEITSEGFLEATAMSVDGRGITMAINYSDAITLEDEHFFSDGGLSSLLLHYNCSGRKEWSSELKSDEYCRLMDVKTHENNLFCAGYYYGTLFIQDELLGQSSDRNTILIGIDSIGNPFWNIDADRSEPNAGYHMASDTESVLLASTLKRQNNLACIDKFSYGDKDCILDSVMNTMLTKSYPKNTELANDENNLKWSFFPNPVNTLLYWNTELTGNWCMELFDNQGRALKKTEINAPSSGCLDLTTCLPGVYTLTISSQKTHFIQRILKY